MSFSKIAIIYNPNSTGSSEQLAKEYARRLRERLPDQPVEIIATDHAGHGQTLAYEIATSFDTPLIISSSGDGGYHDVINGIMQAARDGHPAIASLLPAGNANDHYRNVNTGDLLELIATERVRSIDVLKYTGTEKGSPIERYAHSYIGLGLTPDVGRELNKSKLNFLREIVIVARTLFSIRPVRLAIDGKVRSYDSIIFSNIDSMSKVLKVSEPAEVNDGKFEVSIFRRRHKLQLIATLLKASLVGIKEDATVDVFTLKTIAETAIQADGEIVILDPKTTIEIRAEKQALRCIL
jgi:diacylglycerol kinase (ATP)